MKKLADLQPGDEVLRLMGGRIPMRMRVDGVENGVITCSPVGYPISGWTFDQATGAEIDDSLGWGPPPKRTGSYIYAGQKVEFVQ